MAGRMSARKIGIVSGKKPRNIRNVQETNQAWRIKAVRSFRAKFEEENAWIDVGIKGKSFRAMRKRKCSEVRKAGSPSVTGGAGSFHVSRELRHSSFDASHAGFDG